MGLFQKKGPNNGSPHFPYFTELGPWKWNEKSQTWRLMIYPEQYQNFFRLRAGMQLGQFADFENWMTAEEREQARQKGARVDLSALAAYDVWIFTVEGKEGGRELLAERFDRYWRDVLYSGHKFDLSRERYYRFDDIPYEVESD